MRAHAAFQKAAHYLDVKPILVPVNAETFKADVPANALPAKLRERLLVEYLNELYRRRN